MPSAATIADTWAPSPGNVGVERVSTPRLLPLPKPTTVAQPTTAPPVGRGQVTINPAAPDFAIATAFKASLSNFYPGAVHAVPAFETWPAGVYPDAALPQRLQAHLPVLAIVHRDGRIEMARESLHDPLYVDAVRDALASARAVPRGDDEPEFLWTVLEFVFEYVSGR